MPREYPKSPVVGVGAVIVQRGGDGAPRVVMIQRGTEPLKGQWSLPGGVLELGETLAEGVVREAREETGLAVEAGEIMGTYDRILHDNYGRVRYHYVLLDLRCRVLGGDLRAGSDAASARWFSEAELEPLALEPQTVALVRSALSSLASERPLQHLK